MQELNKKRIRRNFNRAAATYDQASALQQEVASRLCERLELIKVEPSRICDLGCGTGYISRELAQRYPKADIASLDLALNMLKVNRQQTHQTAKQNPLARWFRPATHASHHYICADARNLPLADNSVDMLLSGLTLQWCDPLPQAFAQMLRVVKPGGFVMFSTFGPDTLKELKYCWGQVDQQVHVHDFHDMHDIGDTLLQSGFADPVMDMELIRVSFDDVTQLMRDLKNIGAGNASEQQAPGLAGKKVLKTLQQSYEQFRENGKLMASYEIIYGLAWVPLNKPVKEVNVDFRS